jgi:hypothetical protein
VSTRKLIGLAMLCGLAILIAGGIQLFRIADARDDQVDVLVPGQAGTVEGITAAVSGVQRPGPIVLSVDVQAGNGSAGVQDVAAAWLVTSGGEARQPVPVPPGLGEACPAAPLGAGDGVACLVAFENGDGDAFARFRVGERVLVWTLESTREGGR